LIASILSGARNGTSKTRIMYSALLSFDQLQKYLVFALDAKLLSLDNNNHTYSVTERGLQFLKHFEELQKMEKTIMEKRKALGQLLQYQNPDLQF